MENKLEDFFKDRFNNHEEEVKEGVWANIQTALKGAGLGFLGKTIINKIGGNLVVTIITSAVAIVGGIAIVNYTNKPKETANVNKEKTSKTENIKQPSLILNPIVSNDDKFFKNNNNLNKSEPTGLTEEKLEENTAVLVRSSSEKKKVKLSPNLEIASIFASPVAGTAPLIVTLNNTGNGTKNKWGFGDSKNELIANAPTHIFDKAGEYEITLTSTNDKGLTAIDKIKITVKTDPSIANPVSVFTPNGDGINDYFVFQSKNIVKMKADIFDKNGTSIYTYSGIDGKWDGRNKMGEDVEEGIYFYTISATGIDGKTYDRRGSIRVTR
jgi:gliding motility-associated-like protein